MPPSYPRPVLPATPFRYENRSLRQQRPCQSSPPACLRLEFDFAGMPAVKTCDVSCCRRRYVLTCVRSIAGIKPGSHMPPMYLRRSRRYLVRHFSNEWEHALPACLRRRTWVNFAGMPGVKTWMSNVAGHFGSHIGTVSQAVPAAMSHVPRRHMRTRLYRRLCRRYFGGIWEPGLTAHSQQTLWKCFISLVANDDCKSGSK